MVKKRILVFQDQLKSLCRSGLKYRVIGCLGGLVLVEEETPEETDEASGFGVTEEPEMEPEGW